MSDRRELTREEAMEALDAAIAASKAVNKKYEPKLSFPQRCEILALYRKGCTRESLANLYGVDRRTITHIYNPRSPRYKNVREEELRLGGSNFLDMYLSEEMMRRATSIVKPAVDDKNANNRAANRKAGVHSMRNEFCDYDHRVIIQWVEADGDKIPVSGWYYKDLDSEWPDAWFTTQDPEALKTSQNCYTAALMDISDKL